MECGVARIGAIEQRLVDWADWKRHRAPGRDGDARRDVGETDDAVRALPSPLRETVERCYVAGGDMAGAAVSLGCPQWTIARRIGRAHLMLVETLRASREATLRTAQRTAMTALMADAKTKA